MSWRWVLYPPFDSDEWPQSSDEEIDQADRERAIRYDELLKHWTNCRGRTEWGTATKALMDAEVEVARLRGEEYAVLLDIPALPSPSVSDPYIIADERSVTIIYVSYIPIHDDREEPRLAKRLPGGEVTQPADRAELYGLLRFPAGSDVHFAGPNDEGLHKHRLHGRGLGAYNMFEVGNSRWAAITWDRNTPVGKPMPTEHRSKHYVVTFHDSMVEILAKSFTCDLFEAKWSDVLRHATAPPEVR